MLKKFLKLLIVVFLVLILMQIFNITIFIGTKRIDPEYFADKIKSVPYHVIWNKTKEKAIEVKEVFKKDKKDKKDDSESDKSDDKITTTDKSVNENKEKSTKNI